MTSTNETADKAAAEATVGDGDDVQTGTPGLLAAILSRIGLRSPTLRETLEMGLKGDSEADAAFSAEEREMLRRLLRFGTLRVDDIMVPRADIIALEESEPLFELVRMFSEAGVSRIPLFSETLDDPRGMIHIKDLFRWLIKESAGELLNSPIAVVSTEPSAPLINQAVSQLDLKSVDLSRAVSTV